MNGVNVAQHLFQALVAAWARAAALDAKTITLAHHMQIRKVRHAPAAASVGTRVEIMGRSVEAWSHRRMPKRARHPPNRQRPARCHSQEPREPGEAAQSDPKRCPPTASWARPISAPAARARK